jgi:hypothetical protein
MTKIRMLAGARNPQPAAFCFARRPNPFFFFIGIALPFRQDTIKKQGTGTLRFPAGFSGVSDRIQDYQ